MPDGPRGSLASSQPRACLSTRHHHWTRYRRPVSEHRVFKVLKLDMTTSITVDESGLVPVIDFGLFLNGTNRQEVAGAMLRSFQDTGFVQLVNHGLPSQDIEAMFDWVS